jgi:hypothetical protein
MSFLDKRTNKEFYKLLDKLSQACALRGGPLSHQLYCMVRDRELLRLIEFKFDYTWHFTVEDFAMARQIQAFVAKQEFLDFGVDRRKAAIEKMFQAEVRCAQMNKRMDTEDCINRWFNGTFPVEVEAPLPGDVESVLYYSREKIAWLLGDVPTLSELKFHFGPGSVTSTEQQLTSARAKLSCRLECSTSLLPIVRELLEELPHLAYCHSTFETLETFYVSVDIAPSKGGTVSKNSLIDRFIETQQLLNGLFQKAVGLWLKGILKRVGLDLSDQYPNQALAKLGSETGIVATLDLVSASDLISRWIVWDQLPSDWAAFLEYGRSESMVIDGQTHVLERFGGMGNAYIFELESLLFWSLTMSACKYLNVDTSLVRVYGDDIICPTEANELTIKVLEACGFLVNTKKSFATGPFRESCGADFLFGTDIRPFYVTRTYTCQTLFSMHNFFVRNGLFDLAAIALEFIPEPLILWGPDGYGDGHLIGSHSLRRSRKLERSGFEGGVFDTYVAVGRSFKKRLKSDYVYPVYSIYVRGERDSDMLNQISLSSDPFSERGVVGFKKISVYTLASAIFCTDLRDQHRNFKEIDHNMSADSHIQRSNHVLLKDYGSAPKKAKTKRIVL